MTLPLQLFPLETLKTCARCGLSRPLGQYSRSRGRPDGLQIWCRNCHSDYSRQHRLLPAVRLRHAAQARAYRLRPENHVKTAARAAVQAAITNGSIERPKTCSQCGRRPGVDSRGRSLNYADHHNGYAPESWLDVRFLCPRCDGRNEGPNRDTMTRRKAWAEPLFPDLLGGGDA